MTDGVTTLELSKRTILCLRAYLQKKSLYTRDCEEQADLEMEAVNLLHTVLIALGNITHLLFKKINISEIFHVCCCN